MPDDAAEKSVVVHPDKPRRRQRSELSGAIAPGEEMRAIPGEFPARPEEPAARYGIDREHARSGRRRSTTAMTSWRAKRRTRGDLRNEMFMILELRGLLEFGKFACELSRDHRGGRPLGERLRRESSPRAIPSASGIAQMRFEFIQRVGSEVQSSRASGRSRIRDSGGRRIP